LLEQANAHAGMVVDIRPEDQIRIPVTNDMKLVKIVEPKCKAHWFQDDPYNRYCFTSSGKKAKAGCVAIAAAQALTVLRPSKQAFRNYKLKTSWKTLVQKEFNINAVDDISRLISEIGKSIGMHYGVHSSSANTEKCVYKIDSEYSDISCSESKRRVEKTLDSECGIVILSAKQTRKQYPFLPIDIYKDGHAMVIDGYKLYDRGSYFETFVHVNYGWGLHGDFDGYCLNLMTNTWSLKAYDEDRAFPYSCSYYSLYKIK